MSSELGFVLFSALLWGPTALWLGYRALRGHRSRLSGSFDIASEPMRGPQPAPDEPEALVSQGFWVCGACRSLNRREANRCYSCKTAMDSSDEPAPSGQPVRRMVPVMAEGVPVMAEGVPVMAEGVPVMAGGVPVMAEGVARSSGEAARTSAPPATPWAGHPVPVVPVRDPGAVVTDAPRETPAAVSVCPFLGFKDDPSTRCDFPDPRNLCHAGSGRGATLFASPRRLLAGKSGAVRPQEIGAAHQVSRCLTAAHQQCARYPAVEVVAANR